MKQVIYKILLSVLPRYIRETEKSQTPITLRYFFFQKILGFNRRVYWPVHYTSIVTNPKNVYCGVETCPGFMPGCYIQAGGKIFIGNYTQISANVGIITKNHTLGDNRAHMPSRDVVIGEYCWIAMNCMILPGVKLGDFTVVAAGAVVTKSFEEGYCVIGGNPARIIKKINPQECVRHKSEIEYNGYIHSSSYEDFRRTNLNV
ncbi:acyltransferase [Endozoicomonas numazuensis]|uniref:acyltransferase n=1 Tax=Endozoicomonas numazuensis TaxID=1137799 RepID=UPI002E802899|nr:acyltransferase [Endozoicomonas numazuensis]